MRRSILIVRKEFQLKTRAFASLSHVKHDGTNNPCMVDVAEKNDTFRIASACAEVLLPKEVSDKVDPNGEILSKKGPVCATAIIAGVMAAKQTSTLIPFCHQVPIEACDITIKIIPNSNTSQSSLYPYLAMIESTVKTSYKTGVEMEALVAVNHAALTMYDMLKALSHNIIITNVRLLTKSGGKRTFQA
jgi:cyclic pyranopterin monophosphate synthase